MLIPTSSRPEKLRRCLEALALQSLPRHDFEVLIGIDGRGIRHPQATAVCGEALTGSKPIVSSRAGIAAIRNALLSHARGERILFLSDDTIAHDQCLLSHVTAHEELEQSGKSALIIGATPWCVRLPDRLLDRLVRETSMIDPGDQWRLHQQSRERNWGFRHARTRHLSFRADDARGILFDESLSEAAYADVEWTWRLTTARSLPVLHRHGAIARHDHRIEPEDYLARELALGEQAFCFATSAPRCAKALFGRDVSLADEIRYSRAFVDRERSLAERLRQEFFRLAELPAEAAHPDAIDTLYQQHLILKRWTWRLGLVAGADRARSLRQSRPLELAA